MNQKVGRTRTESKIQAVWLRGCQSDFLTLDISHSVWNWKQCISSCRPEAINRYMLRFTACDSSCASCFPDNPKCMSCVPGTALHHGKCISQCPTHNYLDAHGRCRGRQRHRWHFFGLVFGTEKKVFPIFCFFFFCTLWPPSLPQLLRLLLGAVGIPVHLVSRRAPPPPGPVCGGLRGGSLRSGQHLPQ